MVDTAVLLRPASDASPSGDALDYDIDFLELEIAARGRSEQRMGDAVSAGEEPDWSAVETMALALCERSKDLRVAILLARARLHNAGFAGFEEGLRLLAGYVERFWDSVHPVPDADEDDTIRINALAALSDPADLLGDVRRAPLTQSPTFGAVSLRDVDIARRRLTPGSDTPKVSMVDIDAVFLATSPDELAQTAAALTGCIDALGVIAKVLQAQARGDYGSPLEPLAEALRDAHAELDTRVTVPAAPDAAGEDAATPGAVAVTTATGEIRGRGDIVMLLDRICHWYAANEPASPVPALLARARRLVSQNFLALLLELAPGGAEQFRHLAGIRDDQA